MTIKKPLQLYKHRYQSKRALLQLNSSQLNDIGLTPEQALKEGKRPFWIGQKAFVDENKQVFKVHNLRNQQRKKNEYLSKQNHQLVA